MAATPRSTKGASPSTGSPPDDVVLLAALDAFAAHGFAGMSVRELGRQLGVTHNSIPQRFGSKERLWYAAVDHGFGRLAVDLREVLDPTSGPLADAPPVDRLRAAIVRFVEANASRPALLRIISQEAVHGGERFDHLFSRYIEPVQQFGDTVLTELHGDGSVRTDSTGLVYFLMTNGAGGPFTFPGLAARLGIAVDPHDPAAVRAYAEHAVGVLFDGLRGAAPP